MAGFAQEVTVTDYGEVMPTLADNVQLNSDLLKVPVVVSEFCWGRWGDLENLKPPYDRIACADVLYSVESAQLLAEAITATSAVGTMILVSYEQRDPRVAEAFCEHITESQLYSVVQKVAHSKLDETFQHENIFVLQFKRTK